MKTFVVVSDAEELGGRIYSKGPFKILHFGAVRADCVSGP